MLENFRQINQLESVLQTDEAKEVLGAALLTTTSAVDEGDEVQGGQMAIAKF